MGTPPEMNRQCLALRIGSELRRKQLTLFQHLLQVAHERHKTMMKQTLKQKTKKSAYLS